MYKTFSELKTFARTRFQSFFLSLLSVELLFLLLFFIVGSITSFIQFDKPVYTFILTTVVSLFTDALVFMFKGGVCNICMKVCAGKPVSTRDLFVNFENNFKTAAIACLIISFIQNICYIPAFVYIQFSNNSNGLKYYGICLGTFAVCVIVYYVISLNFLPVLYLLIDFPDKSVRELFTLSFWLMRKNRFRLFLLQLSFVPLILLSFLSLGIGLLIVIPYFMLTMAYFFMNLMSVKADINEV